MKTVSDGNSFHKEPEAEYGTNVAKEGPQGGGVSISTDPIVYASDSQSIA